MLVNEKLAATRAMLEPSLRAFFDGQGLAARIAVAAAMPDLERRCDDYLARSPEDLDEALAVAIDVLSRHRSDCASSIVATPAGAYYAHWEDGVGGLWPTDPVRAPGVPDGRDDVGQEHDGQGAVPVGGGAEAGDRPAG